MRDDAVADWEAGGGEKKTFKQQRRDVSSWYHGVPDLATEVGLLAWKHRSETPIVGVTTSMIFDAEGAATQVSVMPRSFWDEDPRFIDTFNEAMREMIRMFINSADFSPDAHYVVVFDMKRSVPHTENVHTMAYAKGILRGVEFVDALTSVATMPEDLAAAIAWCKDRLPTNNPIMDHFERQTAVHGSSRALHNQVAF